MSLSEAGSNFEGIELVEEVDEIGVERLRIVGDLGPSATLQFDGRAWVVHHVRIVTGNDLAEATAGVELKASSRAGAIDVYREWLAGDRILPE